MSAAVPRRLAEASGGKPAHAWKDGRPMSELTRCEVCGNEDDKAFLIVQLGQTYVFDSFECAIHRLAPACAHCGCRIVGHGIEEDDEIFCCAHCATVGVIGLRDRSA